MKISGTILYASIGILGVGLAAVLFASTTANATDTKRIIRVEGTTSGWMSTGVCLSQGDTLTIAVSGTVKHSAASDYYGPDGNPSSWCGDSCKPLTTSCNVAALVLRVGDSGRKHCVGSLLEAEIGSEGGELYFGINDTPTLDNDGGFDVGITGGDLCGQKPKPKVVL